jgi:hypothetical protein
MKKLLLFLGLLIPALSHAQSYSIVWYKIADGGGSSACTNGASVYSLSGTIGQQDASSAMTGVNYSLTGGFWSLISVVQTAGVPNLSISEVSNSVIISWPNTGSYTLQQNSNLGDGAGWATSGYAVATNSPSGSNSITSPAGNLFFRLTHP